MRVAICSISGSRIPAVVTAAVPIRSPLVTNGDRGSSGMVLRLSVMPGSIEDLLGLLARQLRLERPQVDQHQMVVGPARDQPEPLAPPGRGPAPAALATICRA